jgi:hypothetical protein
MNFILSIVLSSIAVLILVLIPWVGVGALNLSGFFGVFLPYVALIVFRGTVFGFCLGCSAFRITTAGSGGAALDQASRIGLPGARSGTDPEVGAHFSIFVQEHQNAVHVRPEDRL